MFLTSSLEYDPSHNIRQQVLWALSNFPSVLSPSFRLPDAIAAPAVSSRSPHQAAFPSKSDPFFLGKSFARSFLWHAD